MDITRTRITSGILALLTATVVACGSIQGASGMTGFGIGGGDNYLMANDTYGQGGRDASSGGSGPAVAPAETLDGPQLQP
jgi:hypothetical protein